MNPLACVSDPLDQQGFYIHMDVFRFGRPLNLSLAGIRQNTLQAFDDFLCVLRRDDVFLAQHGRVGDGTQNILFI